LMLNVLPAEIAEELKNTNRTIAQRHEARERFVRRCRWHDLSDGRV
jgi:hypothetical protein